MDNICLLIGTGYFGEDIFHKMPFIKHLPPEKIFIASRVDPDVHLNEEINFVKKRNFESLRKAIRDLEDIVNFEVIYNSPIFEKRYSKNDIIEIQKWLGVSFNYIASFDRRFYDYDDLTDSRGDISIYIAALTCYFKEFFLQNEIECFINTIEDDIFSVTAYYVAKKLKIRILGFMRSRFPKNGVIFCEDYKDVCSWKNGTDVSWDAINELYMEKKFLGESNIKRTSHNLRVATIPRKLLNITYITDFNDFLSNVIKIYPYERFIIPKISLYSSFKSLIKKILRKNLFRLLINKKIPKRNYFVFPLHYTEDAQLTFREPLMDQFKLIRNISRALPYGYYLYVKPHPHYLGSDVSLREIYKLKKIPNIKIIDPLLPIMDLIKNSAGVITINSSTGFEALVSGIQVLSFGHEFYSKHEICYVVRDLSYLSETLVEMLHKTKKRETVIDFVKKIYCNTVWIEGYDDEIVSFGLTSNDGEKIADVLYKILGGC